MTNRIRSVALAAAVLLLRSTVIAFPGGVRIVESSGTQNFSTIAAAVAAASDGAVLLVGEGNYSGFSISGKSISIFAAPGGTVNVTQPVVVTGIAADQSVVISGIYVQLGYSESPALTISNCVGTVRVQSGAFKAFDFNTGFCPGLPLVAGKPGVRVSNSARVGLSNCTFTGGHGEGLDKNDASSCTVAAPGGAGVELSMASVAMYDCTALGGEGGGSEGVIGHGGPGLSLASGTLFASASTMHGGTGGFNFNFFPMPCGGVGGDGCVLSGSSTFYEIGCTFVGGDSGYYPCAGNSGHPFSGGTPTTLNGPPRVMTIAPIVKGDQGAWSVSCSGTSVDTDYLLTSFPSGFQIAPVFHGAWLVLRGALLPLALLGNGASISTSFPAPDLPPGSLLERRFVQLGTRASGEVYLGSGAVLLVIDRDSGPDCDSDGLNDFVEVILNVGADVNHNLIPDSCPGG